MSAICSESWALTAAPRPLRRRAPDHSSKLVPPNHPHFPTHIYSSWYTFDYCAPRCAPAMLSTEPEQQPARERRKMYCFIRVQGQLDPTWQHRFEGFQITHEDAGTTLLSGPLPDQAALQGTLLQVIRLGLTV